MDQCLTPLCAFFGDKLRRAITPAELAEYVAQRRRQGVTDRAIRRELSLLETVVRHAVTRHRRRRKMHFALPSRKFLKQTQGDPPPPPARLALPADDAPLRPILLEAVSRLEQQGAPSPLTVAERRHPRSAKLTESQVVAIRADRARGVPIQELASRYGVNRHTMQDCVLGYTWGDVPGALPSQRSRAPLTPDLERPAEADFAPELRSYWGPAYWRTARGRAELHARILTLAQGGLAAAAIARQLRVHPNTVWRTLRAARASAPGAHGGHGRTDR
jgi:hypothetical protein